MLLERRHKVIPARTGKAILLKFQSSNLFLARPFLERYIQSNSIIIIINKILHRIWLWSLSCFVKLWVIHGCLSTGSKSKERKLPWASCGWLEWSKFSWDTALAGAEKLWSSTQLVAGQKTADPAFWRLSAGAPEEPVVKSCCSLFRTEWSR